MDNVESDNLLWEDSLTATSYAGNVAECALDSNENSYVKLEISPWRVLENLVPQEAGRENTPRVIHFPNCNSIFDNFLDVSELSVATVLPTDHKSAGEVSPDQTDVIAVF